MKRRLILGGGLAAGLALAGCSTPPRGTADVDAGAIRPNFWTGRLSLRIDSEPVQTFAALFELRGQPHAGELVLTTPIGSTLARMRWTATEAVLQNGNETRRYPDVDALIEAATGAAIPVDALFAWLEGRDVVVSGWKPDLTQVSRGRLQALRESPQPRADLRIIFEAA